MYGEYDTLEDFAAGDGFDSRDAMDRVAYLERWIADVDDPSSDILSEDDAAQDTANRDELAQWRELIADTEAYSDRWSDGVYFVAEHAFEDHARQLAEDIGAIDPDAGWPIGYIDWERAADALKNDYTTVEILGRTFWYR